MKKLFLLSIVLFINYSCSSDDSSSQNYSNQDILGNWRITEYRDDFYNNISEVDDDEPCFSLSTKTYNSNLTLKDYYKYGSSCQNSGVNNKVFEINGNVLTETEIDGGYEPNTDYVVKYYIEELTSTTLKLKGFYVDEGVSGSNPDNSDNPFYETWVKQ